MIGAGIERLFYILLFGGLTCVCLWGWWSVLREAWFPTDEDKRRREQRLSIRPTSVTSALGSFVCGVLITALAVMCFLAALGIETLIRPF